MNNSNFSREDPIKKISKMLHNEVFNLMFKNKDSEIYKKIQEISEKKNNVEYHAFLISILDIQYCVSIANLLFPFLGNDKKENKKTLKFLKEKIREVSLRNANTILHTLKLAAEDFEDIKNEIKKEI